MKKIFLILSFIILVSSSLVLATFKDMPDNRVYQEAIEELVHQGIINGYEGNLFKPEKNITRAELVKMIMTATGETENTEQTSTKFSDVDKGHWASGYIKEATANEYIKGYDNGTFKPSKNITYAEVAAVVTRVMEKEDKLDKDLSWPENYMDLAYDLDLFAGIMTNDLLADSPARRDNVALIIYNMLEYQAEEKEEQEKPSNKDEIDTTTKMLGIIEKSKFSKGEQLLVLEGDSEEYILYDRDAALEAGTLIVYKFTSSGKINILNFYVADEIDDIALKVEDVDDELIILEDAKMFDLSLDYYTLDGEKLKLNKYKYYELEVEENKDGKLEYTDIEATTKDDLNIKKKDRIYFDTDMKICYIITGLE